jgi:hypothetical protein
MPRADAAPVMTAVRSPGKGLSAFMGLLPFGRQGGHATRTFRGQDAPAIGDAKSPPPVGRSSDVPEELAATVCASATGP